VELWKPPTCHLLIKYILIKNLFQQTTKESYLRPLIHQVKMNSLHNETPTWIPDDDSNGTLIQNGNTLSISSASRGTPFNVRIDSTRPNEDYYFQATITALQGNLSIGVISKGEFFPGWKAKWMFFNGNLTNGSAALMTNWGPRFKVGDSLGVRVTPGNKSLDVTYFRNGASIGTGFRLANNMAVFYPCLHVSGSASLELAFPPELPSIEIPAVEPSGFFGDWKLEKAWNGETEIDIPRKLIQLVLAEDETSPNYLQMSFKVGNSLNGRAKFVKENESFMTIECGPFMSTRMMPPPELLPLETFLGSKKITNLTLQDNATLVLSGPEMKTEWSRYVRNPQPLSNY